MTRDQAVEAQCAAEAIVISMSQAMTIAVDFARAIQLDKEQYMLLAEACWTARERGQSFEMIADALRRGGRGHDSR